MRRKQNLWISHSQKDVSVSFTEIILQKIVFYICCQSPNVYLAKDTSVFFDSSAKDFFYFRSPSTGALLSELLAVAITHVQAVSGGHQQIGWEVIVSAQILQHRPNICFEDIQLRSVFCVKLLSSQYPPTVGTEQLQ